MNSKRPINNAISIECDAAELVHIMHEVRTTAPQQARIAKHETAEFADVKRE